LVAGEINTELAADVISKLFVLDEIDDAPIILHINTEGGDAHAAFAIYDVMRSIRSPIVTIAMGLCASGGLIIFAGGDKRFAFPLTTFFYHEPVGVTQTLNTRSAKDNHEQYVRVQENMNNIIQSAMNVSAQSWQENFNQSVSFTFGTAQAKKWGFVHSILDYQSKSLEIEEDNGRKRKGRKTKGR
jgi:ATP-dependent Clp protease protease subunit